jgi:hypothetical protein
VKVLDARAGLASILALAAVLLGTGRCAAQSDDMYGSPEPGMPPPATRFEATGSEEQPPQGAAGAVRERTEGAGDAVRGGVERAGKATGQALDDAIKATGRGVGKVLEKTGRGLEHAGQALGTQGSRAAGEDRDEGEGERYAEPGVDPERGGRYDDEAPADGGAAEDGARAYDGQEGAGSPGMNGGGFQEENVE